jgi:hypothetical protein
MGGGVLSSKERFAKGERNGLVDHFERRATLAGASMGANRVVVSI